MNPLTAEEVIATGSALYRAVQGAGWPAGGRAALMRASSRLSTEIQICKRVLDDGFTVTPGRIASARKAAGDLIAAALACGIDVAAFAGGEDESGAAA